MHQPIMEKDPKPSGLQRLSAFTTKTSQINPSIVSVPTLNTEPVLILEIQRIQKEAAERETRLLAELDAKHAMATAQLENLFRAKEEAFSSTLKASNDREEALLDRLNAARRQLWAVIIVAILSIVAIINSKAQSNNYVQPVASITAPQAVDTTSFPSLVSEPTPLNRTISPVTMPPSALIAAVPTFPKAKQNIDSNIPETTQTKTGNGGNFSGGKTVTTK